MHQLLDAEISQKISLVNFLKQKSISKIQMDFIKKISINLIKKNYSLKKIFFLKMNFIK